MQIVLPVIVLYASIHAEYLYIRYNDMLSIVYKTWDSLF